MSALAVISVVSMIVSAAGTVYSSRKQYEAGKEAEKIADKNAKLEIEQASYEAKQRQQQLDVDMANTKSTMAAAGLELKEGQSADIYMNELQRLGGEEVAWIKESGQKRAEIMRAEGDLARKTSYAGAFGSLFKGASTAPSYAASAGVS